MCAFLEGGESLAGWASVGRLLYQCSANKDTSFCKPLRSVLEGVRLMHRTVWKCCSPQRTWCLAYILLKSTPALWTTSFLLLCEIYCCLSEDLYALLILSLPGATTHSLPQGMSGCKYCNKYRNPVFCCWNRNLYRFIIYPFPLMITEFVLPIFSSASHVADCVSLTLSGRHNHCRKTQRLTEVCPNHLSTGRDTI